MDYLKYLLTTLAIALIGAAAVHFSAENNIIMKAALIAAFIYIMKSRPSSHVIAFIFWLTSTYICYRAGKMGLVDLTNQDPQKYHAIHYPHLILVLWTLIGSILLHPVSYGLGRLLVHAAEKLRKNASNKH